MRSEPHHRSSMSLIFRTEGIGDGRELVWATVHTYGCLRSFCPGNNRHEASGEEVKQYGSPQCQGQPKGHYMLPHPVGRWPPRG